MELDHIVPGADGGPDDIGNAIPVCFDCHAEIHAYNDRHPRGRKYRPHELRAHKEQWLSICQNKPSVFDGAAGRAPAGPLESMISELDFNRFIARHRAAADCNFLDRQFKRAMSLGAIAVLDEQTKESVFRAYLRMRRFNTSTARNPVKAAPIPARFGRSPALAAQKQREKVSEDTQWNGILNLIEKAYSDLIVFMKLTDDNIPTEETMG